MGILPQGSMATITLKYGKLRKSARENKVLVLKFPKLFMN